MKLLRKLIDLFDEFYYKHIHVQYRWSDPKKQGKGSKKAIDTKLNT